MTHLQRTLSPPCLPMMHHTRWDTNKWEKRSDRNRGLFTVVFFCCFRFSSCISNSCSRCRFSSEQHGGRTRTSSAPGPASSSAAGRAPLCSACWVESVSETARCERWQTAAGPENTGRINMWCCRTNLSPFSETRTRSTSRMIRTVAALQWGVFQSGF